ncbi:sensor histidine kinase, partial [Eisenbergiella porci]
ELVLEVAENLVSNALRYARTEVAVDIRMAGKELELTVMDDGSGFTVSEQQAVKAYFHSNPQDDLEHSGLGMYISRVYCEKHGGRLAVGNAETGGAVVKAVFYAAGDGFQEHR